MKVIKNKPFLNNFSKTKLKVIYFGILFVIVWLGWIWIFSQFNIGIKPSVENQLIVLKNFNFLMYFYYGIVSSFFIIIFGYLINHFVKNKTIIYGIIIIVFLYLFALGNFFYFPLRVRKYNDVNYFTFIHNKGNLRISFNSIIFPWTSFGLFGKILFHNLYKGKLVVKWFDLSKINYFYDTHYSLLIKNLVWTPCLIRFFYFVIIKITSKGI